MIGEIGGAQGQHDEPAFLALDQRHEHRGADIVALGRAVAAHPIRTAVEARANIVACQPGSPGGSSGKNVPLLHTPNRVAPLTRSSTPQSTKL